MKMKFSLRQREDETRGLRRHVEILKQWGYLTIGSSDFDVKNK